MLVERDGVDFEILYFRVADPFLKFRRGCRRGMPYASSTPRFASQRSLPRRYEAEGYERGETDAAGSRTLR